MKNKLSDLKHNLFVQLERLFDESLTGEALAGEVDRSKAVTGAPPYNETVDRTAMEKQPESKKEYLSIADMMKRYDVSRTTFWKMRKAKKIPPPDIKGPDRWKRDKLDAE